MPGQQQPGHEAGQEGRLLGEDAPHVDAACLRICPAQSLPVSRTGTGCFLLLKNDFPARGQGGGWWAVGGRRGKPGREGSIVPTRTPFNHPGHGGRQQVRQVRHPPTYELGQGGQHALVGHEEVVGVAELALGLVALILGSVVGGAPASQPPRSSAGGAACASRPGRGTAPAAPAASAAQLPPTAPNAPPLSSVGSGSGSSSSRSAWQRPKQQQQPPSLELGDADHLGHPCHPLLLHLELCCLVSLPCNRPADTTAGG